MNVKLVTQLEYGDSMLAGEQHTSTRLYYVGMLCAVLMACFIILFN